jgi:hypothetical protein
MQSWAAADISSVILHNRHSRVSLSPPNTPIKPLPARSATGVLSAPVVAQTQHVAQDAQRSSAPLGNGAARDAFRPVAHAAPARGSPHGNFRSNVPPTELYRVSSGFFAGTSHDRPSLAPAASELRASPPRQAETSSNTSNTSGRAFAFPHKHDGSRAEDSRDAQSSAPLFSTGSISGSISARSGLAAPHTRHRSSAAQIASHADNGVCVLGDSADACSEERVMDSLRKQVFSNEIELLRQRLAIVSLELHNRNKDCEQLQRAAAVSECRAEAAERALTDLQQQVQTPAAQRSLQPQADASTSTSNWTSRVMAVSPGQHDRADVSTQTPAASDAEIKIVAAQLIAGSWQSPSVALVSSSVSPPKHSSQKHSVLIEHVNAKADHLAEKLEELLFNMSVQQREFSKLSRTSSSLFRTLVQTLHAVAHCWSILSGGHDEQVHQRRYMMIDRELEGRDVGVFASEACVLIEDAIDAVNLVNMLRAPALRTIGTI